MGLPIPLILKMETALPLVLNRLAVSGCLIVKILPNVWKPYPAQGPEKEMVAVEAGVDRVAEEDAEGTDLDQINSQIQ